MSSNGRRRVVVTGVGAVTPLGNDAETTWQTLIAGSRGWTDHPVRLDGLLRPLRLRGEGLRPVPLDRSQAGAAHGPLCAADPRRGAPGRGRLGHRHQGRRRPHRRFDRHRHRRDQVLPGLLRHADLTRPRPREPVRDPLHHPEHGGGLGVDGARHARAALVRVHGVRRVEHGDRPGPRRHPARPSGRRCSAAGPSPRSTRSASPASERCARFRAGTTIRKGPAAPSTRGGTAS